MKKMLLASLSGYLATAGLALAQPAPMMSPPQPASVVMMPLQPGPMLVQADPAKEAPKNAPAAAAPTAAPTIVDSEYAYDGGTQQSRFWASGEYLIWWLQKDQPGNALVTLGSDADAVPGALGQPGTVILATPASFNQQSFSGLRLEAGVMLNDRVGLSIGGFFLEKQTQFLAFASDPAGTIALAVPFFDLNPAVNGPGSHQISGGPGIATGAIGLSSSTELWGLESNAIFNVGSDETRTFRVLVGFRYADLIDNFTTNDVTSLTPDAIAGGFTLNFLGAGLVPPENSTGSINNFRTRNQFYGAQVGAQGDWNFGRVMLGVAGKVALGNTHQALEVQGASFQFVTATGAIAAVAPGGINALVTNIGIQSRNDFTVIPELTLKLGYRVTDALTATVGYNFIYWSSVVRTFDNVPQVVNSSFNPTDLNFGAGGPTVPTATFERSTFWAQGITFGLEYKY